MAASTFTHFTELAPEIRNQIWESAMPQMGTNMLYFYRRGIWRLDPVQTIDTNAEQSDQDGDKGEEPRVRFHSEFLDDVQLEVPLAFVNRESRSIALPFIRVHRLQTRLRDSSYYPIFVRQMDIETDALYVGPDTWESFQREPWFTWNPEQPEQSYYLSSPLSRLAIHQSLFQELGLHFPAEAIYSFVGLRDLVIIVNDQDKEYEKLSVVNVQSNRWWEFCHVESEAFIWNEASAQIEYDGKEYEADSELRVLINKTFVELHEDGDTEDLNGLECYPSLAVQMSA